MPDMFQDAQLFAHAVRALRQTGAPRTFRRAGAVGAFRAFRAVRAVRAVRAGREGRAGRAGRGAGAVKREELEQLG